MEKPSKKRGGYVTKAQKNALIDFVENHQSLLLKKLDNATTIKEAAKIWEEGANIFNAIPGSFKSWQNWRKCWQDMRNEVRTKVAQNKREFTTTGGGAYKEIQLNEADERILGLIGETCIYGHTSVPESTIQMELPIDTSEIEVLENYATTSTSKDNDAMVIECLSSPEPTEESQVEIATVELRPNQQTTPNDPTGPPAKRRRRRVAAQRLTETVNTADNISKTIEKKMEAKEQYHKLKLELLERMVNAKEASSVARQRIATSLENMEKTTKEIAEYIKLSQNM